MLISFMYQTRAYLLTEQCKKTPITIPARSYIQATSVAIPDLDNSFIVHLLSGRDARVLQIEDHSGNINIFSGNLPDFLQNKYTEFNPIEAEKEVEKSLSQ